MQFATPTMELFPEHLKEIVVGETRALTWKLKPALNGDTISSASLASDPGGLTFSAPVITGDSNTTLTSTLSAGSIAKDYKITGTIVTSGGQTFKPHCFVRVACA